MGEREKDEQNFQKSKSDISSSISKIGFNNFKPFGGKIQSFSTKPITLVYGPNSIGKSSFIHMQSYLRYIFETQSFNLIDTDMFGDEINLGGFEKFVYKRDKNNSITLEFNVDDCTPAIMEYLGLSPKNFTHMELLQSFTKNDIIEIINNSEKYVQENGICHKVAASLQNDRSANNLCSKIYKSEVEYFHRFFNDYNAGTKHGIKIEDYMQGEINVENIEIDFSIPHLDKKLSFTHTGIIHPIDTFLANYYYAHPYTKAYKTSLYNEDNSVDIFKGAEKFINNEYKQCFISEILIPDYINFSKFLLIGEFVDSVSDWNAIDLKPKEIETIADNTLHMINTIFEMYTYYNLLKSKHVPLKITMEIEHTLGFRDNEFEEKPDEIRLKCAKYFIDNTLYDAAEEILLETSRGEPFYFTAAASYSYDDFGFEGFEQKLINRGEFGDPAILDNAPEIYKQLLYNEGSSFPSRLQNEYDYRKKNRNMENYFKKNISIFLSNKKGYNGLIGALNDMIDFKIEQYIGPLRFYPERETQFRELSENSTKIPNSQESWSLLKRDVELRDEVNKWFKKLKTPYEIKYRKLYDIESTLNNTESTNNLSKEELLKFILNSETKEEMVFEDLRNNTQISNRDLGLGISQVLPILISANTHKNTTIAVEQPELHLHPSIQCEIADEFIRSYKEDNNEFLIETHSEHLLLRVMKRMRHTAENKKDRDKTLDLTPDDVCLLYVNTDGKSTWIEELELDEDGSLLDPWPNGFFEEGHRERFE